MVNDDAEASDEDPDDKCSDDEGCEPLPQAPLLFRLEALAHELRQELYDRVRKRPGLNKNLYACEMGIDRDLVDFHMRRLEELGLVVVKRSVRDSEGLCFAAEDRCLYENPDTRVLFGREGTREVAIYLAENPGTTTKEIADALHKAPTTIHHHLRALKGFELIDSLRLDRRVIYHPEETLADWVDAIGDRYPRPWDEDTLSDGSQD